MTSLSLTFHTVVALGGKKATGMEVPAEIVERLQSGKRPAVRVTLNGYSYRSTIAVYGGVYMLPVSAEVRESAGVAAGDAVTVSVELDSEPREVDVPRDLAAALEGSEAAQRVFAALSYSNKRRVVLGIESAKTEETRARRVAKAVTELEPQGDNHVQ